MKNTVIFTIKLYDLKKYICSLILLIFFGNYCFAQYPNKHFQSNSSTQEVIGTAVDTSWGGWKVGSLTMAKSYVDTNAVNLTFLKNIPDVLVNVRDSIFKRTSDAKRWVNLSTIGNSVAPSCQGLIFGGVITLNSGLTLNVTNDQYCINGTTYTAPSTIVTLAAADPVLKRKDVIVSTTSGTTIVITGTSAVNPIEPYVDPQTQIKLGTVDIPANGTTPANITRVVIYNENAASPTEWGHSTTGITAGSVNFANTNFPYIGTISADVATGTLGRIQFTKSDTVRLSTFDVFQMFIRPKASIPDASKIEVAFTFGGNLVSSYVNVDNTKGYIKSNSGSYQNISISRASFAPMVNDSIDGLSIRFTGTNSGFYIDYIQLQAGVIPPIPDYDGSFWHKNRRDTSIAVQEQRDTFYFKKPLPTASESLLSYPSPPLVFKGVQKDTVAVAPVEIGFAVTDKASDGTATPKHSLFFTSLNSPFKTPLSLNTDGSASFNDAGLLVENLGGNVPRLRGSSITLGTTNNTGIGTRLISLVGATYSGVTADVGYGSIYCSTCNAMVIHGVGTDTLFTAGRVGNAMNGGITDRMAILDVKSRGGQGILLPRMNTVQRNGMVNVVNTTTSVTSGGSGYANGATVATSAPNVSGGIQAVAHAVVSSGVVTAVVVDEIGSGYTSSVTFTITPTVTGVGSGATATGTVTTATRPAWISIINTDSTSCPIETWNGSAWIGACGTGGGSSYTLPIASSTVLGGIKIGSGLSIDGSGVVSVTGGGGGVGTLQQVTDAGNTTTNDVEVNKAAGIVALTGGANYAAIDIRSTPSGESANMYTYETDSSAEVHIHASSASEAFMRVEQKRSFLSLNSPGDQALTTFEQNADSTLINVVTPTGNAKLIWPSATAIGSSSWRYLLPQKSGTIAMLSDIGSSSLTVGSSSITSGTNTRILFDNSGVLGEYTISGTGNVAMTTSPTFTTPALGTPSALVGTNATGFPISSAISGLGTGVATFLGTPSSSNLASAVTGETGSGALVFGTSPTLVTPALGTPSSATLTNATGLPVGGISATGTPSSSTYLRGDGAWATVSGGGSVDTTKFNNSQFSFRTLTPTKDSIYIVGQNSEGIFYADATDSSMKTSNNARVNAAGEAYFNGQIFGAGGINITGSGINSGIVTDVDLSLGDLTNGTDMVVSGANNSNDIKINTVNGLKVLTGSVTIGPSAPDASAILEVQSTTQGVAFPNMTTTQKNAISSPKKGLVVYDTTLNKLCVYTGSWEVISSL